MDFEFCICDKDVHSVNDCGMRTYHTHEHAFNDVLKPSRNTEGNRGGQSSEEPRGAKRGICEDITVPKTSSFEERN